MKKWTYETQVSQLRRAIHDATDGVVDILNDQEAQAMTIAQALDLLQRHALRTRMVQIDGQFVIVADSEGEVTKGIVTTEKGETQ